jgi:hypothetical protein
MENGLLHLQIQNLLTFTKSELAKNIQQFERQKFQKNH